MRAAPLLLSMVVASASGAHLSACDRVVECSRYWRDPIKYAKKYRLVLMGTVVSVDREKSAAALRVDTVYRGELLDTVTIDTHWGGDGPDCSGTLRVGAVVLVLTNQSANQWIESDPCGPGGPIDPSSETVKELDERFRKTLKRRSASGAPVPFTP